MLSFRFRLSRIPEQYDPVLHGFLACETEDLEAFCDSVVHSENRPERTEVVAGGKRYEVQRFCPHQGADLTGAWVEGDRYLVCPRHRWQYDLQEGGRCTQNGASVQATCLGPCVPEERDETPPRERRRKLEDTPAEIVA